MGGHLVPAGHHHRHAAVREARRPLRPQARAAGRARAVPDRLGPVRAGAGHDRAHRLSGAAGAGRRRAHRQRPGLDRRHRLAARARTLPGLLRRRVRVRERGRAADRRLLHQQRELALDLLHQPPAGGARAGGHRGRAAQRGRARAPSRRLPGHGAARGVPGLAGPADHARRHHLRLGLGLRHRARGAGGAGPGRVRGRRAPRARAGAAAVAVPQPGRGPGQPAQLRDRLRAVRRADLSPAVPAGGARAQPDRLRPAADPAHGRPARVLDRVRPGHLAHRALQDLPDPGHRRSRPSGSCCSRA